jgi:hypothetical protein
MTFSMDLGERFVDGSDVPLLISEVETSETPNKKNPEECPECGSKMLAR